MYHVNNVVEFKLPGITPVRPTKLSEENKMFIEDCTRELDQNAIYTRRYIKILSVCILIIGFIILILQV